MTGAPAVERRAEPRLPLGLPVVVRTAGAAASGRMVDVSLGGMQVELLGPLPGTGREVTVDLCLSDREPRSLRAVVVRRGLCPSGRPSIAIRFVPGDPDPPASAGQLPVRAPAPTRAAPGSLDGRLAIRQLRALGARLLELSLEDPAGAPPAALVGWVGRLAGELGVSAPETVGTNRDLFRGIAAMHRAASELHSAEAAAVSDTASV